MIGSAKRRPHLSGWFFGEWGFVLKDVVGIEPEKRKGPLGLWDCRFKYRPLKKWKMRQQ